MLLVIAIMNSGLAQLWSTSASKAAIASLERVVQGKHRSTNVTLLSNMNFRRNKLAKLGDAIAISKSETINH